MTLRITVLLWSRDGRDTELHAYEDAVLPLLVEHRGVLLARERVARASADEPAEVQIIELADQDAFDSYMQDPRRIALEDKRTDAIERTRIFHSVPPMHG
jgi:hypothetical protein